MTDLRARPTAAEAKLVRKRAQPQIGFSEWTTDGKLRHPRFLGLRTDKKAGDVVREA